MPIEGKFYTNLELQKILDISKQGVSNLAKRYFTVLHPGFYCSEDVDPILMGRNIDPTDLLVKTHSHPDGATWAELEKEFDNDQE